MEYYAIRRAGGETLGYVWANSEDDAYDQAEGMGLPLHYVSMITSSIRHTNNEE